MISAELLSRIRKLEIRTRRMVDDLTAGAYHSVFKGSGIEFEDVREYTQEDDVRDIDWNVTAKMGTPYIKKYVEERELTVMLLVDMSASNYFGSKEKTKKETAVEIASLLAFSAIRNNDKVGLLMFTDKVEFYLPPKSGRTHILRLIREVLVRKPESRGTNISAALEKIMKILHKKAVVFLISDLIDTESNFGKALTVVNKKHDVVAVRVLDNIELNFPKSGHLNLSDSENSQISFFSAKGKNLEVFKEKAKALHKESKDVCIKSKVDIIDIVCGEDFIKPLMSFFRRRERILNKS
ncbi:MAG: DUF58 domain-containing protein [Lentisphaerota bacterium]